MNQLITNRRFVCVTIIFLVLTWFMFATSREREREGALEYFFNTAMIPLEKTFNWCGSLIGGGWNNVLEMKRFKNENALLREKVAYLETRQSNMEWLETENGRLRDGLGFAASPLNNLIAVETLAVNPSNWGSTLTINKGEEDGISRNMAVISPFGVVGRVLDVRSNTSDIILINDPREGNTIGGIVQRNNTMVIVDGGGTLLGECTIRPVIDNFFTDLKLGDIVTTAQISEIFPQGLVIGKVVGIEQGANKMAFRAVLEPIVDLGKLQTLYVVQKKNETAGEPVSGGKQ